MQTKIRLLLLSIGLLGLTRIAQADVKLPALISEGMVLQQGVAVPLWGWADEGETVRATIQGQTATSTSKNGVWMLRLKPLKAGAVHAHDRRKTSELRTFWLEKCGYAAVNPTWAGC
jgi:sialate O-acetylesterase